MRKTITTTKFSSFGCNVSQTLFPRSSCILSLLYPRLFHRAIAIYKKAITVDSSIPRNLALATNAVINVGSLWIIISSNIPKCTRDFCGLSRRRSRYSAFTLMVSYSHFLMKEQYVIQFIVSIINLLFYYRNIFLKKLSIFI